jgi:Tol biopolymer transport system component/DNA-binding winged helix-turn-helix (wHTH) protein
MLKSHRNLLEPRPSDRLRLGDCVVDVSLREIASMSGNGDPMRVTLKAIGVLLVLIAHAGKVVSREALLEWVWPDTAPTDDVVTQAITQLRKALHDDREHPRYIDTVAKHGYRLIASVRWLDNEGERDDGARLAGGADPFAGHDLATYQIATPEPTVHESATHATGYEVRGSSAATPSTTPPSSAELAAEAIPVPQTRPRWHVVAAVAALSLAAIAAAIWMLRPASPSQAVASPARSTPQRSPIVEVPLPAYNIITSRLADEYRPTLSPDGALVAYVEEGDVSRTSSLWVQTTAPVPPRRLTDAVDDQWDVMPAWSPDGRQIAFIRESRRGCAVMLVPAAGGSAREVGECLGGNRHTIGWYSDGSALIGAQLVFNFSNLSESRAREKAIYRMPLASGRWQRIPYERAPADEDMSPVVSPDGRWIVFQRNLSLGDLWRMPVAGGRPERLTYLRGNFYGITWAPDGRHLLFGRYRDGKVLIAALDLATRQVREFDNNGRESQLYPAVARNGSAVAFELETSRTVVRRVDTAVGAERVSARGEKTDSQHSPLLRGARLFETTGSNMMPSIAPDGRQLVFYSDRSADMRLWWVDQTQADSLRMLEDFVPVARYPVLWDAQSQYALAIGTGAQGMGAYEIDPQRGRATKLPLPDADPVHVAYHSDAGKFLAVADRGQGRLGVRLYDRSTQPWRVLAQMDDVAAAVVDAPNRRILLARMSSPDIWQTDLSLEQAKKIDDVAIQRRNRTMTPSPEGVWVMDSREDCYWRWRLVAVDSATSESATSARERCLGHTDWALVGVSYEPLTRQVYVGMTEEMDSDIGLLPLSEFGLSAGQP